ncbi:MAG: TolC family protein [Pseudomonadota bacterium]|nr:TolC family protein [Pseudomonadota bacterium]
MQIRFFGPFAICTALAGCAAYEAKPLVAEPVLTRPLATLVIDTRTLPFPALAAYRFDPTDGLDEVEVAILAVANNPELKLARDDAAIARAQAFAAGLLPDPQLALSSDLSNSGGTTRAFSFGLSYDVSALVKQEANGRAERADNRKTDLNLLWQEWQVISQARLAFVKLLYARKLMAVLADTRSLFSDRVVRTRLALERGLVTSDAVTPNLSALQDVEKQIFELERQTSQAAYDLNAVLGLPATTMIPLQKDASVKEFDEAAVRAAESELNLRRPDLRALEAGYEAQDQRYRAALLGQFPAINIGLTRARDSSNVYSNGVGITMSLPFLNRNRGNIAIEKATRQKLFDEFQQRTRTSHSDIARILDQQRLFVAQLHANEAAVAELSALLAKSELAFRGGNVDMLLYANARAGLLARQVEQINLQQSAAEQRVALQTVLGVEPANQTPTGKQGK